MRVHDDVAGLKPVEAALAREAYTHGFSAEQLTQIIAAINCVRVD
jgi:hypothetical protein